MNRDKSIEDAIAWAGQQGYCFADAAALAYAKRTDTQAVFVDLGTYGFRLDWRSTYWRPSVDDTGSGQRFNNETGQDIGAADATRVIYLDWRGLVSEQMNTPASADKLGRG